MQNDDEPAFQPLDRLIDRRSFLTRMAALSAGTAAATALPPIGMKSAYAATPSQNEAYADSVRPGVLADPVEATLSEAATLIRSKQISPLEPSRKRPHSAGPA